MGPDPVVAPSKSNVFLLLRYERAPLGIVWSITTCGRSLTVMSTLPSRPPGSAARSTACSQGACEYCWNTNGKIHSQAKCVGWIDVERDHTWAINMHDLGAGMYICKQMQCVTSHHAACWKHCSVPTDGVWKDWQYFQLIIIKCVSGTYWFQRRAHTNFCYSVCWYPDGGYKTVERIF